MSGMDRVITRRSPRAESPGSALAAHALSHAMGGQSSGTSHATASSNMSPQSQSFGLPNKRHSEASSGAFGEVDAKRARAGAMGSGSPSPTTHSHGIATAGGNHGVFQHAAGAPAPLTAGKVTVETGNHALFRHGAGAPAPHSHVTVSLGKKPHGLGNRKHGLGGTSTGGTSTPPNGPSGPLGNLARAGTFNVIQI